MPRKSLMLFIVCFIVLGFAFPALAEDVDYGYWCTTCGRQHGAGESCPNAGGGSSTPSYTPPSEPYGSSAPVSTPEKPRERTPDEKAADINKEGDNYYKNGEYFKAYQNYVSAMFWDSTKNPLYEENLNKAKYAMEREAEEQKKKREEIRGRLQDVNRKLSNSYSDSSIVDLSDKKEPLVVDPAVVKGNAQKPSWNYDNLPSMYCFLTQDEMTGMLFEPKNKRVFETNPYGPLINPLREPERYKAWEEAAKKRHEIEMNRNKAEKIILAMDNDKKLISVRDRIIKQQGAAIIRDGDRLFNKAAGEFAVLKKKNKFKDYAEFLEKEKTDSALKKKSEAIVGAYWDKRRQSENTAWHTAFDKVGVEVKRFFGRHPELKN